MKINILAIAILSFAVNSFAQNSDDYLEIELDGKKAWMHKTSGYVKYENQTKVKTSKTQINSPSKDVSHASTYKVLKSDTYYSISKKHNISVSQLLTWNNLSKNQALKIGKTLKVREENNIKKDSSTVIKPEKKQHTVTKGETLYSISKKYGIPVHSLQRKNNLNNNTLNIGQQLTVE